jgi:hypothetical protein
MLANITARTKLSPVQANQWESLVSDPEAICYVAEFMLNIKLLGQFLDVEVESNPAEAPGGEDPPGIQDLEGIQGG